MSDQPAISPQYAIGADIGGTHITSAVVDLTNRSILADSVFHQMVDASAWPTSVIPEWANTLQKSINCVPSGQLAGVGLAMPGPFDYKNGVSQISGLTKYERLFGLNVKHALSRALGLSMETVRLMNDANCFLFGESWLTKKEYQRIIGITLGTGFGAAFFKNGKIVETGPGVPPNAEFFPIPFRGETAEDFISSRGILREYKAKTGKELNGVRDVAELAEKGEAAATSVMEAFGRTLAEFLGPWLKDFGAESLIIGGNISRAHALFLPSFYKALEEQSVAVDVVISKLLDQAGILGAGRLFDPATERDEMVETRPERTPSFMLESGKKLNGIHSLLNELPSKGQLAIDGPNEFAWGWLKKQLVTADIGPFFLYETSPGAEGTIPGYALEKIRVDPNAERSILIGPRAKEASAGFATVLVSDS